MDEKKKNSGAQDTALNVVRPALIASESAVFEYSIMLEHLLAGMADESIPSALVCPPECDVDSNIRGAVEVIRYPSIKLPLTEPYNINRLIENLKKFKATILYCLCESKESLTRQLAHRLDLPYIVTVDSLRSRFGQLSVSKSCVKIIVPAKSIAIDIAKFNPRLTERIEQINIGTFVEQDCVSFSRRNRMVSMVTIHPLNNLADFENLFSAVRHLAINGYEFILIVIGTGRAERQLRKLLAVLDLVQNVTIVPRLQPWRSILAAGDIFIQPQPSDSFNPFMLEAMAVGCAVAACKGGVDDLIIEGSTAVVFNPDDEISIRSTLQGLLDRKELARQIARGAQQYLRKNNSVSKMISSILQVYYQAQK
jgi:glycosyltransferase involved in cell wall biosynthesis